MKRAGKFKLENKGHFYVKLNFKYRIEDGIFKEKTGDNKAFYRNSSQITDPGDYGVPNGAEIKIWACVVTGKEPESNEIFIYEKGNKNVAEYKISGTTNIGNKLEWLNESDFEDTNSKQSMTIYQVVHDEDVNIKVNDNCIKLTKKEKEIKFPNSKDIAVGFYVRHPEDDLSLVLLENYYRKLAISQTNECVFLLGKMGVKTIRIKTVDKNSGRVSAKADVDVLSQVKVDSEFNMKTDLLNDNELFCEFEGNEIDFNMGLIRNSVWFKNDDIMNGIAEARLSKNKIINIKLETNISQSYSFDIKLAAKVLGITDSKLSMEKEQTLEQIRIYEYKF